MATKKKSKTSRPSDNSRPSRKSRPSKHSKSSKKSRPSKKKPRPVRSSESPTGSRQSRPSKHQEPGKVMESPLTPEPAQEPGQQKKSWKMIALIMFLVLTIIALLITLIIFAAVQSSPSSTRNVCETPECITLAHQLHNWRDESVDPCQDFFKASCGKYDEHTTVEGTGMLKKNKIVVKLIKEFLIKNQSSTSKSEKIMKMLYGKCEEAKNETNYRAHLEQHYYEIYQDIEKMGFWPLIHDNWDKSAFDLSDLISKIATTSEKEGVINLGMFLLENPAAPSLKIEENDEKFWDRKTMESKIQEFLNIVGVTIDSQKLRDNIDDILEFKSQLNQLSLTPFDNEEPFAEYSQLKFRIPTIDFDRIIQNVLHTKKENWDKLKNSIIVMKQSTFFHSIDHVTRKSSEKNFRKTQANFLFYTFFQSAISKLDQLNSPCHQIVITYLPRASLRVFVRNHFNKENLKAVSDIVDEIQNNFIEIIEESTWLHQETKKNAVRKLQNMKKIIGYPEEFDSPGALDRIFEVNASPDDSYYTLMRKIERFHIKQIRDFASSESSINPKTLTFTTNARYAHLDNSITILAPIIDEPLFHSSFPQYAKIAGIGTILGHEMGHGFDDAGISVDENGRVRLWWTKEDLNEYWNRAVCLVEQYNSYDDPDFGKKLNGTITMGEMMADSIGSDIAWNTFKKLDLSKEPKIIGFEDYDIEKLYFQINAMNWCRPRATKTLEQQLKDDHATESFRVNGVFSNMESFAETFNCPVGSPMNPAKKCKLF